MASNTRIQMKSRPTKRPRAKVGLDGSPALESKKFTLPRADKRGYPATKGVPVPTLVAASVSYPPVPTGTWVRIGTGTWTVGRPATERGGLIVLSNQVSINNFNNEGTDHTTQINAVTGSEFFWFGTPWGTWRGDVGIKQAQTGYFDFTISAVVKTASFGNGQKARVYDGTLTARQMTFSPHDHTIEETKEYVTAHLDEAKAVLYAERAGKNRQHLVQWLDELIGVV